MVRKCGKPELWIGGADRGPSTIVGLIFAVLLAVLLILGLMEAGATQAQIGWTKPPRLRDTGSCCPERPEP